MTLRFACCLGVGGVIKAASFWKWCNERTLFLRVFLPHAQRPIMTLMLYWVRQNPRVAAALVVLVSCIALMLVGASVKE